MFLLDHMAITLYGLARLVDLKQKIKILLLPWLIWRVLEYVKKFMLVDAFIAIFVIFKLSWKVRSQPSFTCSKLTKAQEQGVKYVQS